MAAANNLPAEVAHPRSGCTLRLVLHRHGDAATNFDCEGCKESGEGTRYTSVNNPRVHLHTHCALATRTLQHQLVRGDMELRLIAPTGRDAVLCDACYGAVRGFHYHSSTSSLDLHPGCANMPVSITLKEGGSGTTFELRTKVKHRCSSCREMEGYYRPWCYRSTNFDKRVYLHIKCIKEIMASCRRGDGEARQTHHEIVAAGSSRGAGFGIGEEDDTRVIARLQERAGGSSKLVTRICKVLVIFMRVVIGVLFGDPTALLVAGVNLMPALLNQ
uniref:DC1 domain-containing protein n=1 Tax=Oryza punctata TaxID=4537 RepID=A0A0E0LSY4_ORYPU